MSLQQQPGPGQAVENDSALTVRSTVPNTLLPSIDSQQLLQGRKEALISHLGATYRLQATRQGKLILTK